MKRLFVLIFSGFLLVTADSCLEKVSNETSPQAAINSFTLGYYNVKFHDVNWLGHDTTVYVREGGVMYPMTIDQINNRIYNIDSLAYGSVLNAVTCNISSTGTVLYRYPDVDENVAKVWSVYDSIDFTKKVQFIVVSTDESYARMYDFKLNVRKVFPDSLLWTDSDTIGYVPLRKQCATVLSDTLFNFGLDKEGRMSLCYRNLKDKGWYGPRQIEGIPAEGWKGVVTCFKGTLCSVSGTVLYSSENGFDWQVAATGISSVFPSDGNGFLYALSVEDSVLKSENISKWKAIQSVPDAFPDSVAGIFTYPSITNPSLDRVILVGLHSSVSEADIWTVFPNDSLFCQYDTPQKASLCLPGKRQLGVFRYDGKLYALGCGFDGFWQSSDNGLTWYFCDRYVEDYSSWNQYMQLPSGLKGYSGGYSYATDKLGNIWIMTENGQVWRGAINRLMRQ